MTTFEERFTEAAARSWKPRDLGPVLDGTYQPPQPTIGRRDDHIGLFYPRRMHSISSESEAGKTWLALAAAKVELDAGNAVVFIDFEDDEGGVVSRLLALGLHKEAIRDRFAYLRPEDPFGDEGRADFAEALGDLRPTLSILDGVTEALAMHGIDLRDNTEIANFGRLLPRWIAEQGPGVVSLDHVTKSTEGRGRYAIGGQHKLAGLNGAAYVLEPRHAFGVGITGRSTVYIAKDRPAQLRQHALPAPEGRHWFADLVLESEYDGSAIVSLYPPREKTEDFRPTVLMRRVSDALAKAGRPLTSNDIQDRVTGKAAHVRTALACLLDEHYVQVEDGPRGAKLHRLLIPFPEGKP